MNKHTKITAIVLAVVMMLAMLISASGLEIFIIASSDEYKDYTTSAEYLETISVLKGYDDGQLHLEEPILRYQAALFFARIVTGVTDESAWGTGPSAAFTDVPQYGPIMDLIASMNIIRGYGDGRFGYDAKIMYQDMCAMLVRVLGYETDEMVKTYPTSYILKVEKLGLGLKNIKGTDYVNRGQTAQMVYNALTTEIAKSVTDKDQALIDLIAKVNGGAPAGDATKDTYLERNFDVSSRMTFKVVATENYKLAGYDLAEEDYITMETVVNDVVEEWTFPVEGGPTNGVTEADLINKRFVLVFNDKTPTADELEKEDIKVIFAEMIDPDVYENLGELNVVKYDADKKTLTLNKNVVKFDDPAKAPKIFEYTENKNGVFAAVDYADLVGDTGLLETNTYFRFEAYDYDDDGVYDELIYIPYTFGQYAVRTYKDSTAAGKSAEYTMVGTYSTTPVYDVTGGAAKTTANRTNFIERFVGTNATASGSTANYTPGNSTLTVSKANGELAKAVKLEGVAIKSGEFMLYSYNKLTNKLYVAANLGTLQTGTLSGERTTAEAVVIDGNTLSVGILGVLDAETGILSGTDAYTSVRETIQTILGSYEKGKANVRYLEYDGKIAYLEAFAESDNALCADYKIVDIEKTMTDYEKSLSSSETAWDIGFDGNNAVLKAYNPDTAAFEEIKVESLTVSGDTTYDFKNAKERYELGSWAENKAYDLFKANGALYVVEDEDNDGYLELYAAGTAKFDGIVGAPVVQASGTNPELYFSYGKTNKFIDTNYVGVSTDRFASGEATVAIAIGTDGYSAVKGTFGTNGDGEDNALYLSANAMVLRSDNQALIIYDPAGVLADLYRNNTASVWHAGELSGNEGIGYYLFGAATKYVESRALVDADGNIVKDDAGKRLYEHEYKNLINLETFKNENVTIVSTSSTPVVTEIQNNASSVIRVDAENNEVGLTSFGEVFVENGDYRYGGFSWLAAKDRIALVTLPKDGKPGQTLYYNSDEDLEYKSLKSLNVTFIDLDAGADVDYKEYSFADSYVFHMDNDSNRKYYAAVELEDQELPAGTFAIKRHVHNGSDATDVITNGGITKLTAGKLGLIASQHWFRWNGWSDYLIPAVDENYDTVWTYAGSLRVHVTYYAYINYDEKAQSVDAVVVRIGELAGVVGEGDDLPEIKDPELEGPSLTAIADEAEKLG